VTDAVIFDLDGTLLDSSAQDEALYKLAVERVLGKVTFRPHLADYDHVTDTGILLQLLDDNDLSPDPGTITEIKNEFFRRVEAFVTETGPFEEIPGAREMLQRLADSESHGIAIATGGWQRSAEIKLRTAGFEMRNVPLVTSDDAIDRTDIMRIALQAIGTDVRSVTYFGDGPWDRQACQSLGWTFRPVGPLLNGLSSFEHEFVS